MNDSSEFLEVIGEVLAERYEPTLIDGSHAGVLSAVRLSQPALLMVDTPQRDDRLGQGIARAVRERPELRSVPLLLCTAVVGADGTQEASSSSPQDAVLQMPFTLDDLAEAIDGLLHVAHLRDRPASPRADTRQPFGNGS